MELQSEVRTFPAAKQFLLDTWLSCRSSVSLKCARCGSSCMSDLCFAGMCQVPNSYWNLIVICPELNLVLTDLQLSETQNQTKKYCQTCGILCSWQETVCPLCHCSLLSSDDTRTKMVHWDRKTLRIRTESGGKKYLPSSIQILLFTNIPLPITIWSRCADFSSNWKWCLARYTWNSCSHAYFPRHSNVVCVIKV